jgi:hypothetical protein
MLSMTEVMKLSEWITQENGICSKNARYEVFGLLKEIFEVVLFTSVLGQSLSNL